MDRPQRGRAAALAPGGRAALKDRGGRGVHHPAGHAVRHVVRGHWPPSIRLRQACRRARPGGGRRLSPSAAAWAPARRRSRRPRSAATTPDSAPDIRSSRARPSQCGSPISCSWNTAPAPSSAARRMTSATWIFRPLVQSSGAGRGRAGERRPRLRGGRAGLYRPGHHRGIRASWTGSPSAEAKARRHRGAGGAGRRRRRGELAPARLGRQPAALLGLPDPDHPLPRPAAWCRCPGRTVAGGPARRCQLRPARQSAGSPSDLEARRLPNLRRLPHSARPTRSTPSWTAPGTMPASAARMTGDPGGGRRRWMPGCRWTSISAASNTRSCTCSTPASSPAPCARPACWDTPEPFAGLFTQGMVTHESFRSATGAWLYPDEVERVGDTAFERATGEPVTVGRVEAMSKSRRNTVDPGRIIGRYGADTARWFILSDNPPERDMEWTGDRGHGRRALHPAAVPAGRGGGPNARAMAATTRRCAAPPTAPSRRSPKRWRASPSTSPWRDSTNWPG